MWPVFVLELANDCQVVEGGDGEAVLGAIMAVGYDSMKNAFLIQNS